MDIGQPGSYLLRVFDTNKQRSVEPYVLSTRFTPAIDRNRMNWTAELATPLAPVHQTSQTSDVVRAALLPRGDNDFYRLTTPVAGEWRVTLTEEPGGMTLNTGVYRSPSGNWLPDMSPKGDGQLLVDLASPGDYFLQINDANKTSSTEAYELNWEFTPAADRHEPNYQPELASMIDAQGTIRAAILPKGDKDHYQFDIDKPQRWRVSIDNQPDLMNLSVGVYPAPSGNWLLDQSPKGDGQLLVDLPHAGRYILVVSDANGNRSPESYQISTQFVQ